MAANFRDWGDEEEDDEDASQFDQYGYEASSFMAQDGEGEETYDEEGDGSCHDATSSGDEEESGPSSEEEDDDETSRYILSTHVSQSAEHRTTGLSRMPVRC